MVRKFKKSSLSALGLYGLLCIILIFFFLTESFDISFKLFSVILLECPRGTMDVIYLFHIFFYATGVFRLQWIQSMESGKHIQHRCFLGPN